MLHEAVTWQDTPASHCLSTPNLCCCAVLHTLARRPLRKFPALWSKHFSENTVHAESYSDVDRRKLPLKDEKPRETWTHLCPPVRWMAPPAWSVKRRERRCVAVVDFSPLHSAVKLNCNFCLSEWNWFRLISNWICNPWLPIEMVKLIGRSASSSQSPCRISTKTTGNIIARHRTACYRRS